MMKKTKLKVHHLFYLIPIVVLAYLFWQNTKPVLQVEYNLKNKSAVVSELVPRSRVGGLLKDKLGFYRIIKDEPVYLDVRSPRKYGKAEMEIEYSDLENNFFEIGVSRDAAKKNFDFLSLENKILGGLKWLRLERGGLILYQRKLVYNSIGEFFKNPAGFDKTLIYRADAEPAADNLKKKGETVINFPVRKSIKMMVYHDGGGLDVSVQAAGDYKINIYKNNAPVAAGKLDGGIYKIEIVGGDDAIFNKISINSAYVALLDNLSLGRLKKPLKISFAGSRLLLRATVADGIQTIIINKDSLDMQEAGTQYKKIFSDRSPKDIIVPAGNIDLSGSLFFIDSENIFYPRYENLYSEDDLKNADFILAKYAPPAESGGIKTAKTVFDLKNTDFSNGKVRFLLSLPNAEPGDLVKIRGIKIKFTGEKINFITMIKKISNKLMKLKS